MSLYFSSGVNAEVHPKEIPFQDSLVSRDPLFLGGPRRGLRFHIHVAEKGGLFCTCLRDTTTVSILSRFS
jgi:hypothetical protein